MRVIDVYSLFAFLRRHHSLWLALVIVVLLVLTIVLYIAQTAAVAPYIYPLF
jgi:uncharacterized membrane protein